MRGRAAVVPKGGGGRCRRGSRGDQLELHRWWQSRELRELREFWDEKRNDMGWATIYRFENISSGS
jgi:hypothetical protein